MLYAEFASVEVRLRSMRRSSSSLFGTGLRESSSGPIEIRRYRLLVESDSVKGRMG